MLIHRRAADRDVADEVQHFLDEATAEHLARGLSREHALRAARLEMGTPTLVREAMRDAGWEGVLAAFATDVRFALRMLRKSPVFTGVVVLVVALGSGAVTTVFSAMNALVLRPVPGVVDPARVVAIEPARRDGSIAQQGTLAYYEYARARARSVAGVAAWGKASLTIAAGAEGAALHGNLVSANYFDVVGVRPALGRFFSPEEDRTPLAHPVLVVSHAFWRTRLGADPAVIGGSVTVNGHPFTLIGVAPEPFRGLMPLLRADAWAPLMMQPLLRPRTSLTGASWLWMVARLNEGSTVETAQAELTTLAAARSTEAGEASMPGAYTGARVSRLRALTGDANGAVFGFTALLLGAAALVLLIAGVNVAAMLSARTMGRRRELAVRAALGAGRARLSRQLLTEVLVLFTLGGLAGVAVAFAATAALEQLPLPPNVPISLELSPDARVLAFALGVALVSGLAAGLAPALRAAGHDVTSRLRDDTAGAGSRRTLLSRALIVGQLALSLVLLVAAGLFLRALDRGQRVHPGFDAAGVAAMTLDPESWGYDADRTDQFYRALRPRLEALPGATAVAFASRLPLSMGSSVEDVALDGGTTVALHHLSVDGAYFDALRLPVALGRMLEPTDDEGAPPVAVVNETFAGRLASGGGAIGRTFRFRDRLVTIVGVARDAKYATLGEDTPPLAYFPFAQVGQTARSVLVRAADGPTALAPLMADLVLSIDPALPRPTATSLQQAAAMVLLPQRVAAMVTGALGVAGLLLATVGLYGILAYAASRRTREIGIRLALGADRSRVLAMMVGEGMRLAAVGVVVGLALAFGVTRLLEGLLFGVSPLDALSFAGTTAVLLLVALLATWLPARRASTANPVTALRAD